MTKTLQKKFVVTAMAAITVLLLLLLGVINVVNSVLVSGEIQRTLEIIWQSEGGEGLLPPPDPAPRGTHLPLCEAGGETGTSLPGKHLSPAAHGTAGQTFRPLLPGGRRPHPEGGRLRYRSGSGPLPGPGQSGELARPVSPAPGHPVCGAIPQLNTKKHVRTDRNPRSVFFVAAFKGTKSLGKKSLGMGKRKEAAYQVRSK